MQRIAALLFVLVLAGGCGKKSQVRYTPVPRGPQPNPLRPAPEPEWKKIENFSQSLERISLAFDAKEQMVTVGFSFVNLDRLDPSGIPLTTQVEGLQGKLDGTGKAVANHPKLADFSAEVACQDPLCEGALITLHHRAGIQLKGTATITKKLHKELGKVSLHTIPLRSHELSRQASELVRMIPSSNSLHIMEIAGGRTLFAVVVDASRESPSGPSQTDPENAHRRWLSVVGTVGKKTVISIRLGQQTQGRLQVASYSAEADVEYLPEFEQIAIGLIDPGHQVHHLYGLVLGKKLILTEEDRRKGVLRSGARP